MMKKLAKILGVITVAGAAVAGFWYFLDRKNADEEEFLDLNEDDTKDEAPAERAYVSLDTSSEDAAEAEAVAKRSLKETVKSVAEDMKQKAEDAAKGVGVVAKEVKETASDFAFKAFDKADKEDAEEAEEKADKEAEKEETSEDKKEEA